MHQTFDEFQKNFKLGINRINTDIDGMSVEESKQILIILNNNLLSESIIKKLFGAATGIVLGRKIMSMLLKILNVKEGHLYNILTSKTVLARVGYEFGKK